MGDDSFQFRSYCRECKEERPVVMKRNWLYEALRTETEIKIITVACHTWILSAEERRNLRKKLKSGQVGAAKPRATQN